MTSNIPPDLEAEFLSWEQIGDEAWAMIDKWEKEEQLEQQPLSE